MVARCIMWMCKPHPDVSPTHYLPEGPCWFTLTLCSLSCWSQQMILQSLPCEEHLPGALRMMSTVTKPAFQRQIWISLEEKCSLTSRTRLPVIGTKQGSLPKRKELLKESFLGNDLLQRTWSALQLLGKLLSFLRCIQKPHWYLGHLEKENIYYSTLEKNDLLTIRKIKSLKLLELKKRRHLSWFQG